MAIPSTKQHETPTHIYHYNKSDRYANEAYSPHPGIDSKKRSPRQRNVELSDHELQGDRADVWVDDAQEAFPDFVDIDAT